MTRACVILMCLVLCGCETPPDRKQSLFGRRVMRKKYVPETYVMCTVDVVTIPKSHYHKLQDLWAYTQFRGIRGPNESLRALNGLRMARSDPRFKKELENDLAALRTDPRGRTHVRMAEGRTGQAFRIGNTLTNHTLWVWKDADSVYGRHFRRARYQMYMELSKVNPESVELDIYWQVQSSSGRRGVGNISPLDSHVELALGQSLIIGPANFSGDGVGRAFLSGVDERAVKFTFLVITPTKIRIKDKQVGGGPTPAKPFH